MNLVLLTQDFPPRPGGMARYYADLAAGLGRDCTVLAGAWEGAPPGNRGNAGIRPLPFSMAGAHRPWNLLRAGRATAALLEGATEPVLLVGNVRPYGPLGVRLARRLGVPLVMIYHGNDLLRTARRWKGHPLKGRRWRSIVDTAALHVVNSAFTAGRAVTLGLPGEVVAVAPPEVDTARFHPAADEVERQALRRRFGWGEDRCITLFVGRLVARKGLGDLLRALAGLPAKVELVVAGPGDPAPWEERARLEGVAGRVRFLGEVPGEDLPLLHRAADLFAGPSVEIAERDDVEGFGIVFLEAAASGLPVLATRSGGIPEAVEDGVGGILVEPGSPEALASAWRRLAADPALRRTLGEGGRNGRAAAHGPGSSARALLAAFADRGLSGGRKA